METGGARALLRASPTSHPFSLQKYSWPKQKRQAGGFLSAGWSGATASTCRGYSRLHPQVLLILVFRDELERAAEYSEARLALLWAVTEKFVAQTITTPATQHL